MFKKLIILVFFVYVPLFAQSVDTAWVRRYNGPENLNDGATALAMDDYGNMYITGFSNSGVFYDYVTIKYYPNGDTAWVRRYNGPVDSTDYAHAIAVDTSGNVYVAGGSGGIGAGSDLTTIKYSPNGDTLWVRRLNGEGSDWGARDIAVDNPGNVYVAGASSGKLTTIKYYPNGDTAWVRRFTGLGNFDDVAYALDIDDSENVYVTGYSWSTTSDDYATIKYYPNGDTAWERRFAGQQVGVPNIPFDIAIDNSGNTYVTGTVGTIKYDPNGTQLWSGNHSWWGARVGTDMAVDEAGTVYVAGYSLTYGPSNDYLTVKYYPNEDTAWLRAYNGPANAEDVAWGIAVDTSGNIYVTGKSVDFGTWYDFATIKYTPNGDSVWVQRYNGPGPASRSEGASAIAVDNSGNVYVIGRSSGIGTGSDFTTIKYVQFLRGDTNKDGQVSISDIVYIISYLFKQGPGPIPAAIVGDANCDDQISISDIVYLIAYLYKEGPPPCI